MRRSGKSAALLATAVLCMLASASGAPAQIAFAPCAASNEFACGHLQVPLDPSGGAPGTITLAIRRHRAVVGEEKSAVIALAGGPGQAALPFTEQFMSQLGQAIAGRDLIVFDQRGTGLSHALSCRAFESRAFAGLGGSAVGRCASQLGPSRSLYTTADSVADIEAIRRAGGYEKLVLFGTSYGTKVAEEYAQAYPSRVEALVLDSVVAPDGPDQLNRSTFAAVPRILGQLCSHGACAHVTPDPTRDLAVLIRRLGRGARARWIDGDGRPHTISVTSGALLEALVQGDLEPTLRSEFPAAVHAAARGDMAEIARLLARARSGEREVERPSGGFDTPLYFATVCEESLFPWSRAVSPARRLAEATEQIRALGARTFWPFTAGDVLDFSDMPACAYWPFSGPAPVPDEAPFPHVPTLILSGADDLRTPTVNARGLAAEIPGSQLLVVPNTGHSVLSSDPSSCSRDGLQAFFAGKAVKPCAAGPTPALLRPTPLPPASLADVASVPGNPGHAGRTLNAVLQTVSDFEYQLAVGLLAQVEEQASLGGALSLRVGGLRSGWGELIDGKLRLHAYSYVPGVNVSGEISSERIAPSVSGPAAAAGTLNAAVPAPGTAAVLTGELEGQAVRVTGSGASAGAARAALAYAPTAGALRGLAPAVRQRLAATSARLRALIGVSG